MALVIDGAAMAELTRGPRGPFARHLISRATRFQQAAKAQVQPHSKTRCLERTIVKRPVVDVGDGLSITVISDTTPCSPTRTSYSLFVHEGTEPHQIVAAPGKVLAFDWPGGYNGPGVYFARSVNHPGTAPNRFLADNLRLFVAP